MTQSLHRNNVIPLPATDYGDSARLRRSRRFQSVVWSSDGEANFLDAVHRSWRGHGLRAADLVEPGFDVAVAVRMLVGGVQKWMVWVEAVSDQLSAISKNKPEHSIE